MPFYSYTATSASGITIKGKERAENYSELISSLRERGYFCNDYRVISEKGPTAGYKFKTKHLAIFCRQLASMLTSGINLVRAVYVLQAQETIPRAKKVLLSVYEELQRGRAFSEALESNRGAFPNLFIAMVSAGEVSGNLDMIIERVAEHYASDARLQNKVKSAMAYPTILGILMFAVIMGLFGFIMPMFAQLFSDPSQIPPLSRFMLGLSDFIRTRWYLIGAAIVLIIVGSRFAMKFPPTRFAWDRLICRGPKQISKLIKTIYTARFARTMANLFASGLQLVECIDKSVAVLGNRYITKLFEGVVEDVKRGEPLSASINKINLFDGMFTSTIYIGEESGRLDEILVKSADFYEEEADTAIQTLVSMMEPVMIIVMGAAVCLVLASIFPMLYGSLQGVTA
jgi:type IV pilus assembly protein PilC